MSYDPLRMSRFSTTGESSGVQSGYGGPGQPLYSRGEVLRNIKPYKSLNQFASPQGLRRLRGMTGNFQRLENIAAKAVLKDAGIKRGGLRTDMDRDKFGKPLLQQAKAQISQGYDTRTLGQTGLDIADIENRKLRQATAHVSRVRRNRAIMATDPLALGGGRGVGYDISQGHRPPKRGPNQPYVQPGSKKKK